MSTYNERLQQICAVEEFCVPALVGRDEMRDRLDDIATMFDWSLSRVTVSVYLCLYLNHSPFSFLPYCSEAKNTFLKKMMASMIQKWKWTIIHASYWVLREIDCTCTFGESQITPAILPTYLHGTEASLRVCLWFPRWLGDTPRCAQPSLQHSDVFPNWSKSLPWNSCSSHQRSQLLPRPAGMPSKGLILSWNWRF